MRAIRVVALAVFCGYTAIKLKHGVMNGFIEVKMHFEKTRVSK